VLDFAQPVGESIENDREGDQQDAAEEKQRVAAGRDHIARYGAGDKCQTDPDGEGYRQPGDFDGGDKQQVGDIEDRAATTA